MKPSVVFNPTVLWPDSKRGPWRVTCWWANVDGYARLIGIDIRSFDGRNGPGFTESGAQEPVEILTASMFRRLRLEEVADGAFEKIRSEWGAFQVEGVDELTGRYVRGGKTGRRPLTAEDLAQVASAYRAGGTKPTKAVAEELGISVSAAGKRVARAREAGLLERTTQGRAGGPSTASEAKGSHVKKARGKR